MVMAEDLLNGVGMVDQVDDQGPDTHADNVAVVAEAAHQEGERLVQDLPQIAEQEASFRAGRDAWLGAHDLQG